jgi:hypothetical protein
MQTLITICRRLDRGVRGAGYRRLGVIRPGLDATRSPSKADLIKESNGLPIEFGRAVVPAAKTQEETR